MWIWWNPRFWKYVNLWIIILPMRIYLISVKNEHDFIDWLNNEIHENWCSANSDKTPVFTSLMWWQWHIQVNFLIKSLRHTNFQFLRIEILYINGQKDITYSYIKLRFPYIQVPYKQVLLLIYTIKYITPK